MTAVEATVLAEQLASREQQLDPVEQRAQLTLYRLLAEGAPVAAARLAAQTGQARWEIERFLDRWPGVETRDAEVVAFQGMSLTETPHRLRVDDSVLYAWCAWDTLFLPELLGRSAEVTSVCPTTGRGVCLCVDASGPRDVAPVGAVLSFRRAGPVFVDGVIESFCRFVHFFTSAEAAQPWIARHPGTFLISPAIGFDIGRRTNAARFGSALTSVDGVS
jgi:alkylmercury lyase